MGCRLAMMTRPFLVCRTMVQIHFEVRALTYASLTSVFIPSTQQIVPSAPIYYEQKLAFRNFIQSVVDMEN